MGEKRLLQELLKEDQEPFLLNKYIWERRSQMKRALESTVLQVKKRKPLNQSPNFPANLCRSACLFSSLSESPPPKSPCKSPNAIFLHIPSRTAALLVEAALRIHKHSSPRPRPKPRPKPHALFASFFKRLTLRKPTELHHVSPSRNALSPRPNHVEEPSTATPFCQSPFRFVLQTTSPSSAPCTPELLSPDHRAPQEKEVSEAERLKKFESGEEEEEDKEQCSPVCVLEPPFEDDEEGHVNEDEEEPSFDLECSYAIVQRAKQQLLYKLRRFEKLAELDPVELEKRMLDEEGDEEGSGTFMEEDDGEYEDSEASSLYKENDLREVVLQALCQSRVHDRLRIPEDFKKLVYDLIMEEERGHSSLQDRDLVIRRICKRLELWKEVECNTINMMIDEDFSGEDGGWKKNVEQIRNVVGELELAIFGFLVEEFSEELVC